MLNRGVRSSGVVIATAIIAAVGLFLLVVNLGEHPKESRLLVETILFLPLLLCSVTAVRARRS